MDPWGTIARLPRREIEELQNRRLRYFINRYLYPFSPYYRRLFDQNKIRPQDIQGVKDLQRIPFISKTDFLATANDNDRNRDFILQPDKQKIRASWPPTELASLALTKIVRGQTALEDQLATEFKPVFMTFTTGTTNRPVPFFYSNYDIQNLGISGGRMLKLFDIKSSENILNMFPYAPHLAFWQVVFGALSANALALNTGGGKVIGTEGNIAAIEKLKPSIVLGVPGYVYHVMREASDKGRNFAFIRKIVLGAARVTLAFKLKLIEMLTAMGAKDVAVLGTYGFTEAKSAWGQCPSGPGMSSPSGYHLYPDKEIFEIVDPKTGQVQKEGRDGEIVYTALDARASVVMRYRTGDFVKGGIRYEPCPSCGRTLPQLSSDITRLSNITNMHFSKVKGTLVDLNCLDNIFAQIAAVDEWQVEIKKKNDDQFDVDEIIIYACARSHTNQDQAESELRKKFLLTTELTPNAFHWISRPEMVKRLELETANKEKRIVDKRPKE